MNIIIFGENKTSLLLVNKAIESGHYVTVFLPVGKQVPLQQNEKLHITTGDILSYTVVEEAMQGQEIVINVLETDATRSVIYYKESAGNILKAMHANKVDRLIVLSKIGVGYRFKQSSILYKLWLYAYNRLNKKLLYNMAIHETYVERSKLHWTIVKTAMIKESKKPGHDIDISRWPDLQLKKPYISTASLEAFIMSIAVKPSYINEIIGISGK